MHNDLFIVLVDAYLIKMSIVKKRIKSQSFKMSCQLTDMKTKKKHISPRPQPHLTLALFAI